MPSFSGRRGEESSLRSALISEGIAQLKSVGVNDLSLREIAKQVGVSHMAPYKHFQNKAELLSAIAARGYESLGLKIAKIPLNSEIYQQLELLGESFIALAYDAPDLCNLMFGGEIHQSGSEITLKTAVIDLIKVIREILASGVSRGDLRDFDLNRMVQALWALITGFVMSILGRSSHQTAEESQLVFADILSMWIVGVGS